jgi:hypothetical protein
LKLAQGKEALSYDRLRAAMKLIIDERERHPWPMLCETFLSCRRRPEEKLSGHPTLRTQTVGSGVDSV